MNLDDDEALVEAAQSGDRDALDRLLRRHVDRLHSVCRRITGNDADADDALQEGLIAIARSIRGFDRRSRFSTWAYRVTTNACLDELRRRRRRPEPVVDDDLGEPVEMEAQLVDRVDVDAALRRLPPDFRAAVVLRDLCGLDYAEIGEVLDIPAGTVRSRIARGRVALIPFLAGNPSSPAQRPSERS